MHEASIAQSIVETVLTEAEKKNAVKVESVEIEIGELTFLGIDQVSFWLQSGFEGTIAQDAKIDFKNVKGVLKCNSCGYEGELTLKEDPAYHLKLPTFACPKCKSPDIEVIKGKDTIIRRIRIITPDMS